MWQLNLFSVRCKALSIIVLSGFLISDAIANIKVKAKPYEQQEQLYAGSQRCMKCHQLQYQKWQKSDHFKSMMQPSKTSVLGDFNDVEVIFDGSTTAFTQHDDKFFITTQNSSRKIETYEVKYTFGHFPLQQYLIDIGEGKLQAFDVAWDSRAEEEGGSLWFKLLPDQNTSAKSPFHWSRHLQNWNSRCAECHSSQLNKGYNSDSLSYKTTFTEINIACEECHGGGTEHIEVVEKGRYNKDTNTGFQTNLKKTAYFGFDARGATVKSHGEHSQAQVNACGGCHSRRQVIGEINPKHNFHDQYRLRFLDQELYYVDGQVREEVFVLGSFLQSKMYKSGVTCTNCHDPHTGEVLTNDNRLCTQCHQPSHYDTAKHHHHKKSSRGAFCINCHMPTTTYMGVDARRDHAFSLPSIKRSLELNTPNACERCHGSPSRKWTQKVLLQWSGSQDMYSKANAAAISADVLMLDEILSFIEDEQQPAIKRATLLSQVSTMPSKKLIDVLIRQLNSDSILVRRAAVAASHIIPVQERWQLLRGLIADQSASVRYEVAEHLVEYLPYTQGKEYKTLSKLLEEHEQQLSLSQDVPAGQAAIALYALKQGETVQAENAYLTALKIEPGYLPALLNLADLYREQGKASDVKRTLDKAVVLAPEQGAVHYSLGLYWVRQGKLVEALQYLKSATEKTDRTARYFYTYAVALEHNGKIEDAIITLQQANNIWPNQYDLLLALVSYLEKSGKIEESRNYFSKLSAIAPNSYEVLRRRQYTSE